MEKRIIRPRKAFYETIIFNCMITFELGVIFAFMFFLGGDWDVIAFFAVFMLVFWGSTMLGTMITYRNNQIEIISEKEIVIDQKVREWENPYSKIPKGKWTHQRIEIDPADVIRIGCSFELYKKCLYYHEEGMVASMYQEVVIEMKDGKRATFDYYIYMPKDLNEIINILSRYGEVQITERLRKILRKYYFRINRFKR